MSNFPYIPFYPGKWLGRTAKLSAAERGVFITLICEMYERMTPLEVDYKRLARLCATTPKTFENILNELLQDSNLLVMNDGGIWNLRVEKEIENAEKKSKKQSENSKRGWEKRKEINGDDKPRESHPKPDPNISKDIKKTKAKKEFEILVEVIGEDRANSVIEHRKFLKKPLTERAAKLLANEFSKTKDPKEAADQMVMNGWQGFKASWAKGDTTNQPASISQQPKPMGIAEMAMHQANQLKAEGRSI